MKKVYRKITCINEDNVSVSFDDKFSPFLLLNCDGLYSVSNNINMIENSLIDGSTFVGSMLKMRNIILTIAENDNHLKNRNLIYQLFKPKALGRLIYHETCGEEEISRTIDYYVESILFDSIKRVRTAQVSLLCPDPLFTDLEDIKISMSSWKRLFTFPHEFNDTVFGKRVNEKLKSVYNDSATDNIGIKIVITAEGNVKNPSIFHVEKNQYIKIGNSHKHLNLKYGDQVIITTETNNKNVHMIRDGNKININEYLDESTEYIQLKFGSNTFRYSAEEGENSMLVEISFKYKYIGV